MLKFKKVYIDSSYKVSGTSSEFTIDLPETVQLEDNMLCQIHEVSIPHSWYSINENNNNFYVKGIFPPETPSGVTYGKLIIPVGNYTATEVATQLETSLNTLDSGSRTNSFSVSYLSGLNKIQIQSNYPEVIYTVLTDADVLVDSGERFVETVDPNNLRSISKVLGVYTTSGDASTNVVPYITGFIDLTPVRSLCLHCNEISNFNELTVAGNASITKKIDVTVPYLGIINDNELSNFGYIERKNATPIEF